MFEGYKTYIAAIGLFGLALYQGTQGDVATAITTGLAGLAALGLRHAVAKAADPAATPGKMNGNITALFTIAALALGFVGSPVQARPKYYRPYYYRPRVQANFTLRVTIPTCLLPWRNKIERLLQQRQQPQTDPALMALLNQLSQQQAALLQALLAQRQQAPSAPIIITPPPTEQHYYLPGPPKQILDPSGPPKQILDPSGPPKQILDPRGTPKQQLDPGGPPKQDLTPKGAPKQDLDPTRPPPQGAVPLPDGSPKQQLDPGGAPVPLGTGQPRQYQRYTRKPPRPVVREGRWNGRRWVWTDVTNRK